jgi:transcriptional regulator with XRE-family HTH domain
MNQKFYEAVARQVAERRNRANPPLTQEQLASRTRSLSRSTIANIESGRQRIALHQLVEVADAVGANLLDLLPSTPATPSTPDVDPAAKSFLERLSTARSRRLRDLEEHHAD